MRGLSITLTSASQSGGYWAINDNETGTLEEHHTIMYLNMEWKPFSHKSCGFLQGGIPVFQHGIGSNIISTRTSVDAASLWEMCTTPPNGSELTRLQSSYIMTSVQHKQPQQHWRHFSLPLSPSTKINSQRLISSTA